MYEPKKTERYLRVNFLGPGPRLMKKRIYRAAVSRSLRNTGLDFVPKWLMVHEATLQSLSIKPYKKSHRRWNRLPRKFTTSDPPILRE